MPANYSHTTRADGTTLSAAIYNADHQKHIDFGTPAGLDDYQTSLSEKQIQSNPNAGLASALSGDLAMIRDALRRLGDTDFWYLISTPAFQLTYINKAVANTGTKKEGNIAPFAGTIIEARAHSDVAPTGSALIFDLILNGTSIWDATPANRVQVAATMNSGTQTAFDTPTLAAGDRLDLNIDQVGSGTNGGNWSRVVVRVKPVAP